MAKLQKEKMEMKDIWDASRPNVHKSKKKYSRKGKNKKDWDGYDEYYPDQPF
tara:strand:- start:110 stop:265 length:156 start_codon:yes stop_codon:yes gene_type:complete